MLLAYIHPVLDEDITAIGGHYTFLKEELLPFKNKTILYFVGCSLFDSACCGTGGVSFARVSGFVHDLKFKKTPSGVPISMVEPISDQSAQKKISQLIRSKETVNQVEFYLS